MESLTGEAIPRKRPIILYIIIGVLLIVVIVLSILLAINSGNKDKKEENNITPNDPKESGKEEEEGENEKEKEKPFNPIKEDHFINVTDSFYSDDIEYGAYSYHGIGNYLNSEYYKILDVYNMQPTKNRAILTNFKTYQQTSEFSSPCSLIIMIMTYYGLEAPGERECSIKFGLNPDVGCARDSYDRTEVFNKSSVPDFAYQLRHNYNLEVLSNGNFTEETMPFHNESQFSKWVKSNINEGNIIIVLYNDWAGQYAAIIGIDDMGTESISDDVIILADAYDTTDHLQDGYTIWGLERFYHLWQYTYITFYKNDDSLNHGQFILIKKPKSN